jgi:hypothetical protein
VFHGKRDRRLPLEWADFPAPGITFYFCNDTLMLLDEH